jgi:hypothetical protein
MEKKGEDTTEVFAGLFVVEDGDDEDVVVVVNVLQVLALASSPGGKDCCSTSSGATTTMDPSCCDGGGCSPSEVVVGDCFFLFNWSIPAMKLLRMTGKSSPCRRASSGCVLDTSTAMCLT